MKAGKIAVVGGTGYLGSRIVLRLLEAGYRPIVVARRPEQAAEVLPGVAVEGRRADITNPDSLRSTLEGCTHVFSTVALLDQSYHSSFPAAEEEVIRTNVEGTLNVLRAAHEAGSQRVILTSSASVRYTRRGLVANEGSPPTDLRVVNDAYVRSKLRADQVTADFRRETGLSVVTIMPGALIGPGDRSGTLLNGGVLRRLNGKGRGGGIEGGIPVVDVRDVARAAVAAMEADKPADSYLVVAETISSQDWSLLISRLAGPAPTGQFLSARKAFLLASVATAVARLRGTPPLVTRNQVMHIVQNQQYDCSRVQHELGITFTPIETSVREMIEWFIVNGLVAHPEGSTSRGRVVATDKQDQPADPAPME